jgi:hypothetical protein
VGGGIDAEVTTEARRHGEAKMSCQCEICEERKDKTMNPYTGKIEMFGEGELIPAEMVPVARPLTVREQHRMKIDKYAPCGCGSGKKFKFCCFVAKAEG